MLSIPEQCNTLAKVATGRHAYTRAVFHHFCYGKIYKLSAWFALMRNVLKLKLSNLKFPGIFSHPSRRQLCWFQEWKIKMNIFAKLLRNGKEVGKETQLQVCLCVLFWEERRFPGGNYAIFPEHDAGKVSLCCHPRDLLVVFILLFVWTFKLHPDDRPEEWTFWPWPGLLTVLRCMVQHICESVVCGYVLNFTHI